MSNTEMYGNDPQSSSTTELVPGSLRAFRAWRVDSYGILSAAARSYTWDRGNNSAKCIGAVGSAYVSVHSHYQSPLAWGQMTASGNFWVDPPLRAVKPHRSPDEHCSCGFYAQYSSKSIEYRGHGVVGAIQVSGKVVMGTTGVRAENARIEALVVLPSMIMRQQVERHDATIAEKLERNYQVPVYTVMEFFQENFPEQDVSAIAPQPKSKPPRRKIVRVDINGSLTVADIALTYDDGLSTKYHSARDLKTCWTLGGVTIEFIDSAGNQFCAEAEVGCSFTMTDDSSHRFY